MMERFIYGFAYGGGIAHTIGLILFIYSGHYLAAFFCGVGIVFSVATVKQAKP